MNRGFGRALAVAVLAGAVGAAATAADPADARVTDKAVVDALRDVHNHGADLYNTAKDYVGAYRVYEGALKTVRPLLGHHAAVQKTIDDGLAAATKEADPARRAFVLHETIEKVRADLKAGGTAPKSVEPKKPIETKKPEPAKKPEDKKPVETKKPADVVPRPKAKDTTEPAAKGKGATVTGTITLKGKPLAGADLMLVSLDQKAPKVIPAKTDDDGKFSAKDVPAGKYAVAITLKKDGKSVLPAKYATTDTSGLTAEVKAGANALDFALQ